MGKLTPQQWATLRAEHERGEQTTELSRRYGIDRTTIHRRAKREGWKERGALHEQAVQEAQQQVKQEVADTYRAAALAAHDRHLKVFRALQGLGARCLKLLEASLTETNPLRRKTATAEIHALAALTSALRNACDAERTVMQLDKLNLNGEPVEDGFDKLCRFLEKTREARGGKCED